jgi:hypothetical protein
VEDRKLPLETVIGAYDRWWHTPLLVAQEERTQSGS